MTGLQNVLLNHWRRQAPKRLRVFWENKARMGASLWQNNNLKKKNPAFWDIFQFQRRTNLIRKKHFLVWNSQHWPQLFLMKIFKNREYSIKMACISPEAFTNTKIMKLFSINFYIFCKQKWNEFYGVVKIQNIKFANVWVEICFMK